MVLLNLKYSSKKQKEKKLIEDIVKDNQYYIILNVSNISTKNISLLRKKINYEGHKCYKLRHTLLKNKLTELGAQIELKPGEVLLLVAFKSKTGFLDFKKVYLGHELLEKKYLKHNSIVKEEVEISKGLSKIKAGVNNAILEKIVPLRVEKNFIWLEKNIKIDKNQKLSKDFLKALMCLELKLNESAIAIKNIYYKKESKLVSYKNTQLELFTYEGDKKLLDLVGHIIKDVHPCGELDRERRLANFYNYFKSINKI